MASRPDFWKGISAGMALLAAFALFGPRGGTTAEAAPMQGVDNQGKYALAVGGSEPNRNDLVWVLHEHPPHPRLVPERGADTFFKPTQITLSLYKAEEQGRKMRFVAARDIAYDVEFQNFNQLPPDVPYVFNSLKEKSNDKK